MYYKGTKQNTRPYQIQVIDPQMARVVRDMFDPIEPNQTYTFQGKYY